MPADIFDDLMAQIHRRAKELPAGSYTTKLIEGGVDLMGAKVREEAEEVIEASETPDDREHVVYEACDLIYHLWVLLGSQGISVDELRQELLRREGVSGLVEKQNRKS